ncbi:YciI family protein [Laspinema olomoucense]|uniref:YciI family protein n=1 Tax=Laspinema olomoucense TaxID=3231600 RepID=UPI0021BB1D3C|nr:MULTISPECIES: YciI family protein [unclassified Laspinema]MCT7992007.1 YciI family protein [Laspinema sp. D3a]MCT7994422.1 YciI family protein [Laspinema sp. D3c]
MPWFVKIEKGIVDKPTFDRHVPAHKAYVEDLIAKGHNAKTGYWQRRGGGMLLFKAESMEEAQQIVAEDPLVKHGCVNYDLYEWCIVVE